VSKVQNWPFSLGYAPTDYCCFGNYNQNRNVETRFGFKTELVNLIIKAYTDNNQVYVGIVLNHNSGMQLESNPFTGPKPILTLLVLLLESLLEQVPTLI
jgi:alpha-amylase